jgi:two-component system OmpR family response regulator
VWRCPSELDQARARGGSGAAVGGPCTVLSAFVRVVLSWRADNVVVRADLPKIRVLVVDDELNIAELIATALRYEGFEIRISGDGTNALAAVRDYAPDLVVLDVMLPDMDGFEVQSRMRSGGRTVPVLFLTARDAVEDRVRGLTLGADDYMTKPFSLAELVARVHAILRRTSVVAPDSHRLAFSDLELDEETREVRRGERRIVLSPTEFMLLRYLLLNPRRVLSKAQILDHVWQYDFGGDGRIVETYISYLRKKVDRDGPPLIHTLRGVGYSLRLSED